MLYHLLTFSRAVVKHYPVGLNIVPYDREFRCYSIPSIASSPYIRRVLEYIGHEDPTLPVDQGQPRCMVFEWMDTDLWQLPSKPFRSSSNLPRIVVKSILEALVVINGEKGFHTDLNPNNVFLSDVDGPAPVVKLGDLGNLMGAGPMFRSRFQGVAIRAPEVWKHVDYVDGKGDIWSLGVTLAHWLAGHTIFGAGDKIIEDMTEQWCIAKLIRLVGPIGRPDPSKIAINEEFIVAEWLESSTFVRPETGLEEQFIKVGTIRRELEKVEGPIEKGCIDFIENLLAVDSEQRPSALEALKHPWLQGSTEYDSDWSVD